MHPLARFPQFCLLAALLLAGAQAHASAVYKWVDEHGVTWFSEEPPAGEAEQKTLTRVPVDSQPPVDGEKDDLQTVLDVADSIEASRLERERVRLEKERLILEQRQLEQPAAPAQDARPVYDVWYGPPYYNRPWKPGYPARPPHARPPLVRPPPGQRPPPQRPPSGSPPGRVTLGR